MKKKAIITVEITDGHLKVVSVDLSRNRPVVIFSAIEKIPPQSDAEISKKLTAIFKNKKLQSIPIVAVVPRRFAIMRQLSLPSHADAEIEKMVDLQVVKQIPYPKNDIILDYSVLEKQSSGYAKVLVIAVHKEVAWRYVKIFTDAQLPLSHLTLSSEGLLSAAQSYMQKVHTKKDVLALVVNIDSMHSELCFCREGRLLFSRSITFGARDMTPEHIAALIEQIDLTLATYAKDNASAMVSEILIISSTEQSTLLKEKLHSGYENAPAAGRPESIRIVRSLDALAHKKGALNEELIAKDGISLGVNFGLVLAEGRKTVNFLPAEVRQTQQMTKDTKRWLRFSVRFLCAYLLGVGVFGAQIYNSMTYVKQLTTAIETATPQVQNIREQMKRLDFIKSALHPSVSINDILYEVYTLVPASTSFKSIQMSEAGILSLQGVSEQSPDVNVLQQKLVNSKFFENVRLQYATKRKIFKGELTDFKITCEVVKAAK